MAGFAKDMVSRMQLALAKGVVEHNSNTHRAWTFCDRIICYFNGFRYADSVVTCRFAHAWVGARAKLEGDLVKYDTNRGTTEQHDRGT